MTFRLHTRNVVTEGAARRLRAMRPRWWRRRVWEQREFVDSNLAFEKMVRAQPVFGSRRNAEELDSARSNTVLDVFAKLRDRFAEAGVDPADWIEDNRGDET